VRPVNLIPPEERRGERTPLRAGALSYVVVGGLLLALAAITGLVFTGNQVTEREGEKASLEGQLVEATARAQALAPYGEFASVEEARQATVISLAQSRFDWERVLRELAIVIPESVWLTDVTGTVAPEVALTDSGTVATRAEIPGPALELIGCARGQVGVAELSAALRDIDGVTRVGVQSSKLPETAAAAVAAPTGEQSASGDPGDECRLRDFVAKFEIVVAFDEVPIPAIAAGAPTTPAEGTTDPDASVAEAQQQEQQAKDSAQEQSNEAKDGANNVGVAG
jgi:Tfp pilus assembly protein PilN